MLYFLIYQTHLSGELYCILLLHALIVYVKVVYLAFMGLGPTESIKFDGAYS